MPVAIAGWQVMIETDCQKLLVAAAEEVGGRGILFNNRFVIGIPDLLIKLPSYQPMILEAKLHKFSARTLALSYQIADIGATKLQKDQLRDWSYAGMLTGVVSFIMETGADVRSLRMALYSHSQMLTSDWSANILDHTQLGEKSERMTKMRELLMGFANG